MVKVTLNPVVCPPSHSDSPSLSLDGEPFLLARDVRRVSDISHINQLRREVSGLSFLASEFYTVTKTQDPDNISLDR